MQQVSVLHAELEIATGLEDAHALAQGKIKLVTAVGVGSRGDAGPENGLQGACRDNIKVTGWEGKSPQVGHEHAAVVRGTSNLTLLVLGLDCCRCVRRRACRRRDNAAARKVKGDVPTPVANCLTTKVQDTGGQLVAGVLKDFPCGRDKKATTVQEPGGFKDPEVGAH